jgi:diguanylate cyclase (GGDEF)-like protein
MEPNQIDPRGSVQPDTSDASAVDAGLGVHLENALQAPWSTLSFPGPLESRYIADTRLDRMRYQRRVGLVVLVAFLACLAADAQMLPDIFRLALTLRVGGFLLGLSLLTLLRPSAPGWLPDAVMSFFAAVASVVVVILFAKTHATSRSVYFDGLLVIVMAGNICLQQRFRWVLGGCAGVFTIAMVALFSSNVGSDVRSGQVFNLIIAIAMTLAITQRLEWQHRHAYLLSLRDALRKAELQRSNAALLDLSALDGLTGLANRRTVDRHLATACLTCAAANLPISVIMLDVDWFKRFNDTYGHPAGDACLIAIADVLRHVVRAPGDLAGRYGGEEFIIILPGADRQGAHLVAQRISAAVQALNIPHVGSQAGGIVTASLGIACASPATDGCLADLLQAADVALYAAKQGGRARIEMTDARA